MIRLLGTALCFVAQEPTAEEYFAAIRANRLEEVKALIACGNANVKDRADLTPLHHAIVMGTTEIVRAWRMAARK